jgi:hypothetical protein
MSPFVIFVDITLVGSGPVSGAVKIMQGLGHQSLVRCEILGWRRKPTPIASLGNSAIGAIRRRSKNTKGMAASGSAGGQSGSVDCYSIGQISHRLA